ncbi:MAG: SusD/RagB family nutrient-binding outer membrane lipoprotein [Cytophagales bacterium]|nr:MAG: SusD/RagB family nutrient-binding outer membrane lipoprotein [Cytophagales bacterium]
MKRYLIILFSLVALTGCEKPFAELEQDPNRATSAPASLVFQGVLNDMYGVTGSPWGGEQRWNQFYCSNYNYYATNEYSWTTTSLNFTTLKNVVKMEEEARRAGGAEVNPYSALGKLFRAFYFDNMTRRVGDVPMTDALKGLDNTTPKYDSQKAVYVQVLKWLDDANADLTALIAKGDRTLAGDIYLANDLRKWQKVVNTFKMRVLVSLSAKDTDSDLNVKARFAEVLNNPAKFPLMESTSDDLQYTHNTINKYSRNPSNFGFNATRENMAKTYVDLLVARKDPRIFVVAEPAEAQLKAGKKHTDYDAFVGASSGEDLADMSTKVLKGDYSYQNRKRYYTSDIGELVDMVGYTELQFNLAEGISRGWAAGNAETYYNRGILTSMTFYGLKDGDNTVTFSRDGGAANFDNYTVKISTADYLAQPLVKYAGNTAAGLNQILTQKYIAFFQNSGMEAWYNQRRTGVPTFLTGVGTGNSNRIPKRWLYPTNERVYNADNYKAAVAGQFGADATGETVNALMWVLK